MNVVVCLKSISNILIQKLPLILISGNFELAQFHFHWGSSTGSKGSEHTMFGNQFDAELHFVHYNTKCGRSLGEAIANCAGNYI